MKPEIHPTYQDVVFMDSSVDPPYRVLTKSTRTSEEMTEWEDGNSYPLIRVEISSASHPFYTGKMKLVDTAGMIDRYNQRYGTGNAAGDDAQEEAPATEAASAPAAAPEESAAPAECAAPAEESAEASSDS
ncbi:MAG: 50S ribosomal protein L31 [Rhodospirillaceae bacterium]|nr:50S ribosomal protein L31 [Rhodospirillaceae bacterium]